MNSEVLVDVNFVANNSNHHVFTCAEVSSLFYPSRQIQERTTAADVIEENSSSSASVVGSSDGSKGFLSCRVPDLQSDWDLSDLHILGSELDSHSGFAVLTEG